MKLKTFIERPVLSIVISVAIVLVGCIALFTLPIEQFPSIAPPTVEVTTSYPGANAETVQKSVIVPLEEAINGVENMTYISSTASNAGDVYITIYFKQGTDPDMAAVNVQNRVSKAQGQLPSDVTRIGVVTNKQQKSMLKAITLWSPDDSYDAQFINNYLQIIITVCVYGSSPTLWRSTDSCLLTSRRPSTRRTSSRRRALSVKTTKACFNTR